MKSSIKFLLSTLVVAILTGLLLILFSDIQGALEHLREIGNAAFVAGFIFTALAGYILFCIGMVSLMGLIVELLFGVPFIDPRTGKTMKHEFFRGNRNPGLTDKTCQK